MAETETAINERFAAPGAKLPEDVMTEIQHILRLLALSVEELFYKWESYAIKMGVESTKLDSKTARDFKKDLQDTLERESRAKGHTIQHGTGKKTAATPRGGGGGDVFGTVSYTHLTLPTKRIV